MPDSPFWRDEKGYEYITVDDAYDLAQEAQDYQKLGSKFTDEKLYRERSAQIAKKRRPERHDWRHFAARSKSKAMGR